MAVGIQLCRERGEERLALDAKWSTLWQARSTLPVLLGSQFSKLLQFLAVLTNLYSNRDRITNAEPHSQLETSVVTAAKQIFIALLCSLRTGRPTRLCIVFRWNCNI